MSDLNYLDWYANESKIIDAFTSDDNEPYVEVDDMNEVINGNYQTRKENLKKQLQSNDSKSVTFPHATKDQSPSISSVSNLTGPPERSGQSTRANGPPDPSVSSNRCAIKTQAGPSTSCANQSKPSFMDIVQRCSGQVESKFKRPLITKRKEKSSPEQPPLIKRPAERSLTKYSAAINTALHLNFEQFKFQENSDTFFDDSMLRTVTMKVKRERCPMEESKAPDESSQTQVDRSEPPSPATFKRSLEDADYHLPPKKRLLLKWLISQADPPVRNAEDMLLDDDFDDLIFLNSPMNGEQPISEDNPADSRPSTNQTRPVEQVNKPLVERPSNPAAAKATNLSHRITDFFPQRKSANSSQSQASTEDERGTGSKEVSGKVVKFNYFKPPEIVRIEPDARLENNSGYSILVDKYSDLFEDFQHFNEVQIGSISLVFETNDSFVLKATTSSGKSTVLEFAIIKLLNELKPEDFKVILVEPVKAIINEKKNSWKKFAKYGLNCCVLSTDSRYDPDLVESCSLIICTPDQAEELTRNPGDLDLLTKKLRLVLIDEIQYLADERRGHCLEAFICRLKMNRRLTGSSVRFIAASSTVGELDCVCQFFGENTKKIKFGEETRIVPLEKVVIGYDFPQSYNEFKFDKILTDNLIGVLNTYQRGQQVQIFCPTRKLAEQTAEHLRRCNLRRFIGNTKELIETANKISLQDLKECFLTGVSYHHGGLPAKDKAIVEQAFKKNLTNVLVCTTSLAVGINLPSNLIIIKGTFRYINSKFTQYNENEIAQMIARAGRQQRVANTNGPANLVGLSNQTSKATVIIMTKNCYKTMYERILNDKAMESKLRNHLCEYVNAEVILQHIGSFEDLLDYIKHSYLYLRLTANPELYNISKNADADKAVRKWAENILRDLNAYRVVRYVPGQRVEQTEIGLIMSYNRISFPTLKSLSKIDQTTVGAILHSLCNCQELTEYSNLRNDEKAALTELNKGTTLRFPIRNKGTFKIQEVSQKINCLIQAELGDLLAGQTSQPGFSSDAYFYVKTARKLAKALVDLMYAQQARPTFSTFRSAVLLSKSLNAGIWEDSSKLTKQFPKIGSVLCGKLTAAGYTTFEKLRTARPSDIEMICNRNPPFGDDLLTVINRVPDYEMRIVQQAQSAEMFKAELTVRIELKNYYHRPEGDAWLIVGDEADTLLFSKKIAISLFDTNDHTIEFEYMVGKVKNGKLSFGLINDSVVGADCVVDFVPKYSGVASKL